MKPHSTYILKFFDLSIVIVNYNAKNYLDACLSSVYNTVKKYKYEVIVVDNASCDDSVEFMKERYPKVRIITNNHNVGYAKANNQGIKVAQGNFILLLNPDTVLYESSIDKMMDYQKRFSDVGIVGPKVINPGNRLQWDSCGSYLTPFTLLLKEFGLEIIFPDNKFFGKRLIRYWNRNSSRAINWVSGVCMLIRKQVLQDIGLLDERFFAYMEDMDLCRRARVKHWRVVFLHEALIIHRSSSTWQHASIKQLRISLSSEKKYLKKYYGFTGTVFFQLTHFIGSSIRLLLHLISKNYTRAKHHFHILGWLVQHVL